MYRPYSSSLADSRPFMDVESQIRGLSQDYVTSFNTGNYDQVAGMFAQDGVLMAPHHDSANGHRTIERLLRELGEAGYNDMRVETMRVDSSGDMAMELGRYSVTIRRNQRHPHRRAREVRKGLAAAGGMADSGRLLEQKSSGESVGLPGLLRSNSDFC